jgi:hypothetical protein
VIFERMMDQAADSDVLTDIHLWLAVDGLISGHGRTTSPERCHRENTPLRYQDVTSSQLYPAPSSDQRSIAHNDAHQRRADAANTEHIYPDRALAACAGYAAAMPCRSWARALNGNEI